MRPLSALNFPSSFSLCLHSTTTVFISITIVSKPTNIHEPFLYLVVGFSLSQRACESGMWGLTDLSSRLHSGRTTGHVHRLNDLVRTSFHFERTYEISEVVFFPIFLFFFIFFSFFSFFFIFFFFFLSCFTTPVVFKVLKKLN